MRVMCAEILGTTQIDLNTTVGVNIQNGTRRNLKQITQISNYCQYQSFLFKDHNSFHILDYVHSFFLRTKPLPAIY